MIDTVLYPIAHWTRILYIHTSPNQVVFCWGSFLNRPPKRRKQLGMNSKMPYPFQGKFGITSFTSSFLSL
ncbi:hypothetical protein AQUCO_00500572v1 [Aquilegia coerulea]|uniref:Uncharacterized protein n=1 Tax=Aquilegia coerulea TaxID=218851 RepID=A0A2G5ESL8_AQUCA|nr:hypothetical protein AQUCO_00500572v1 [Aquilegia coerulea]